MREKKETSRELFEAQFSIYSFAMNPKNPLVVELGAIDQVLDEAPEILDWVLADIETGGKPTGRRSGASAEQVLRSAILMQLRGLRYRQLAEEIDANPLYRKFTRFYGKKIPHFSTLNNLIKMISAETMRRVNETMPRVGIKKKVEDGAAIRHDTTVAETGIASPLDSRLLNDSVRVINRCLERLRGAAPEVVFCYHNHTRRAKKRAYQIVMGKGKNIERRRRALYLDLLALQKRVRLYGESALSAFASAPGAAARREVMGHLAALQEVMPRAEKVHAQAYRRVILGESLAAKEKIVSIFETHTDIICRGKKGCKAEFGHKVDFATGRSGLIVRYEVFRGNPGDNEVLPRALDDHIERFGKAPRELTADRRYHSAANEAAARAKGVVNVALPKAGRLSHARRDLQRASWFRRLLRWRAGIEGNLSTLLRRFGLKRCLWKGQESFNAYIGLGVLTYNLRLLAGHLTRA